MSVWDAADYYCYYQETLQIQNLLICPTLTFLLCVQFLLEVARQKNQTPLPLIKPYTGPRLPPDRYCLTAPNYRLKSIQKKVPGLQQHLYRPTLAVSDLVVCSFRCRRLPAGSRCLDSVSAPSPADRPRRPWVSVFTGDIVSCRLFGSVGPVGLTCVFSTGAPSIQSVTTKVGGSVSLTGQRFTMQIPQPSQTATTKASKKQSVNPPS